MVARSEACGHFLRSRPFARYGTAAGGRFQIPRDRAALADGLESCGGPGGGRGGPNCRAVRRFQIVSRSGWRSLAGYRRGGRRQSLPYRSLLYTLSTTFHTSGARARPDGALRAATTKDIRALATAVAECSASRCPVRKSGAGGLLVRDATEANFFWPPQLPARFRVTVSRRTHGWPVSRSTK